VSLRIHLLLMKRLLRLKFPQSDGALISRVSGAIEQSRVGHLKQQKQPVYRRLEADMRLNDDMENLGLFIKPKPTDRSLVLTLEVC
jgi:hypothetical protein